MKSSSEWKVPPAALTQEEYDALPDNVEGVYYKWSWGISRHVGRKSWNITGGDGPDSHLVFCYINADSDRRLVGIMKRFWEWLEAWRWLRKKREGHSRASDLEQIPQYQEFLEMYNRRKAELNRVKSLEELLEKARQGREEARFEWKAAETLVKELEENRIVLARELESTKRELAVCEDASEEEVTVLRKANEGFRYKLKMEAKEKEVLLTRISKYSISLEDANETIADQNKVLRKAYEDEMALQDRVKELEGEVEERGNIVTGLTERVDRLRAENTRVVADLERAMGLLVSQYENGL